MIAHSNPKINKKIIAQSVVVKSIGIMSYKLRSEKIKIPIWPIENRSYSEEMNENNERLIELT